MFLFWPLNHLRKQCCEAQEMNRILWRIHYWLAVFSLMFQMLYALYLILAITAVERIKRVVYKRQTVFFNSPEELSSRGSR